MMRFGKERVELIIALIPRDGRWTIKMEIVKAIYNDCKKYFLLHVLNLPVFSFIERS